MLSVKHKVGIPVIAIDVLRLNKTYLFNYFY